MKRTGQQTTLAVPESSTPHPATVPAAIVTATADSLPNQVQSLSRARAFAEPLLACEQLDTGENILAHALSLIHI